VDEFFIENGVHRAIAARENGLLLIPAVLYESGAAPRTIWVRLDQLHSPRRSISRSDPRHNYPALEQAMGSPQGRSRMPPIEVQPLGAPGQPSSVPLAQVVITA
jgi:hypothetical protein